MIFFVVSAWYEGIHHMGIRRRNRSSFLSQNASNTVRSDHSVKSSMQDSIMFIAAESIQDRKAFSNGPSTGQERCRTRIQLPQSFKFTAHVTSHYPCISLKNIKAIPSFLVSAYNSLRTDNVSS
ncbi:hypothetical protein VNO77_26969 [Canavalia gladiata]|uniref:Uncharacterized protein n=1 Tax=Canavalia gladiata TaxID=3824 RepID=A0AAN9QA35_CANGL